MTGEAIDERRRQFAAEISAIAGLRSPALVEALASVPRERFLPAGPWIVRGEKDFGGASRITPDDDPRHVYENVSVAIDAKKMLFNGAPAALAQWIDALALESGDRVLHVGCALGYYTALMAHSVGPRGRVAAVEVDAALAAQARTNLASMPWATVTIDDATGPLDESFDAIFINAGVTHPRDSWLDRLRPDGRLVLPLTATMPAMGSLGKGLMMLVRRSGATPSFETSVLTFVSIYSALGLRDETLNAQIAQALMKRQWPQSGHLRRDAHDVSAGCWLHTDRFCLSA